MQRNKDAILRELYVQDTASVRDVAESTYLSKKQTQRAIDRLTEENKIEVYAEEEIRGGIPDRKIWTLANRGFQEIRDKELAENPEIENSEKIEKLQEEILALNSKIKQYTEELEEWQEYTKQHNKTKEMRIKALENKLYEADNN